MSMHVLPAEKKRYIEMLLQPMKTQQLLDQTSQAIEVTIQELYYHPMFFRIMTDPNYSNAEKKQLMKSYFQQRATPVVIQKFLEMLLFTNKLGVIDDQDKPTFLSLLREEVRAIHSIGITVSTHISDYVTGWIHREISEMVDYAFVLDISVDPAQISGIKVRADKFAYEDTIKRKLEKIEPQVQTYIHNYAEQLLAAEYAAKQPAAATIQPNNPNE